LAGERVSAPALADTLPINHGAAALQQLLLKLRTRASLMLIVAHPDDEDGGMLTYESRGQGARVAMLTLNRGEGGQNLMTADFNDALGLIRTQELLAADRYMGVDQFFGSVVDFGFSKAREEALEQWGHDRVLYDAVRCVRLYRPLIVASVFVGGPTDGHGQHQVAGQMAQEVFNAAADPKVFPEMGLPPWAPMKVYARARSASNDPRGIYDVTTGQYQPARYMNYVTGIAANTPPAPAVIVHEGDVSTALGMNGDTYSQFARKGLALQKSQNGGGGGRGGGGGLVDAAYARYGSRVPNSPATENSFFDGIDTSLAGIASLAPSANESQRTVLRSNLAGFDNDIANAQSDFTPDRPEATAHRLHEALVVLDGLIGQVEKFSLPEQQKYDLLHELRIKRVQANNALVLALGVTLEPMARPLHPDYAVPLTTMDKSIAANVRIANGGKEPLKIVRLNPEGDAQPTEPVSGKVLAPSASILAESNVPNRNPQAATRPYFSRPDIEQPFYDISNPALRNAPVTPDPLVSSATLDYQGVQIEVRAVVPDAQTVMLRTASPDTLAKLKSGSVPQAAVFVPPVSIKLGRSIGASPGDAKSAAREHSEFNMASSAGIIPIGTSTIEMGALLQVDAYKDTVPLGPARIGPDQVRVTLNVPEGSRASVPTYNAAMEPVLEHFTVLTGPLAANQSYVLTAKAELSTESYAESYRAVGYPGIVYTNYYTPATYKASVVDLHTARDLKVAYLPGTGDDIPAYLPDMGITPTILGLNDLTAEKLAQYDAVVLGIRAYSAHAELAGAGSKPLLDYARQGGVVIVQYNNGRYGAAEAPYAITTALSSTDHSHDVVVEAQPVVVLAPDAPVLNWPNKITPADFDHWVEERGHGFAGTWAPEYQALLETHDPGQDPQKGGLLVARSGKGYYIYCGLALYRQLPEGVPGAYRLLANLLSVGKNPALQGK
jgi:LmbE family N-acetylglucosaminyl deacetylase